MGIGHALTLLNIVLSFVGAISMFVAGDGLAGGWALIASAAWVCAAISEYTLRRNGIE